MIGMKNAKTPELHYLYFFTLSSFSDPQLLQRTLDYAITSGGGSAGYTWA